MLYYFVLVDIGSCYCLSLVEISWVDGWIGNGLSEVEQVRVCYVCYMMLCDVTVFLFEGYFLG